MKLILKKPSAERLIEGLDGIEGAEAFRHALADRIQLRHATETEVGMELLTPGGLDAVERIARANDDRAIVNQIGTWRRIISNPREAKVSRLAHLEGAIVEWVLQDVIKGWLFQRGEDGDLRAWSVSDIRMDAGRQTDPHVVIRLGANTPIFRGGERREAGSHNITLWQNDLPNTVEKLLGGRGWLHETAELHAEYEAIARRFGEVHQQVNAQFRLAPGRYAKAGRQVTYNDRTLTTGATHRCVNDETLVERPIRDGAARESWDERISEGGRGRKAPGGPRAIPDDAFVEMPTHHLHLVYDLDAHEHAWAPSSALKEYVYHPEKVDDIVLPDDHRELIDILTEDADVLLEDVVEGKSGGTIVLLEGEPGVGKTLLCEVYAEKMRKPLYRVQAGQLGLDAVSVGKGIEAVFDNAARWGAVVLIDEADVYIRKRGDDMEHNAVVAALLLAFERQTVISFLATNRSNDVDEAVISRCVAVVHFEYPTAEASRRIWRIQAKAMGVNVSDETIDSIVAHHGEGSRQRASGRDIRALLKLAYRYERRRGKSVDAELLRQLGAFKRL